MYESDESFISGNRRSHNMVRFYKNRANGKDYVEIRCPGQPKTVVDRPVKEEDKNEYSFAWNAYQQGADSQVSGTPIEMLPGVNASLADDFRRNNIHTIEAAAEMSDLACQKMLGAIELRKKAQAYISGTSSENLELRKRIEELEALMRGDAKPEPKKRGPKPKIRVENVTDAA